MVIQGLETLLQRPSHVIPLTQVLDALKRTGLLVVVHGRSDLLSSVSSGADLEWSGRARAVRRRPPSVASATRWLLADSVLQDVSAESKAEMLGMLHDLKRCESADELTEIVSRLDSHHRDRRILGEWIARAERMLIGSKVRIEPNAAFQSGLHAKLALLDHDDWAAGRIAMEELGKDSPDPELLLVWTCVCACVGLNPAAVDVLRKAKSQSPWVLDSLLRALAGLNRAAEIGEVVMETMEQEGLGQWFAERLLGEAYLHGNADMSRQGYDHLLRLQNAPNVPLSHRADILHNLGVAESNANRNAEAIAHHEAALELNPYLESATAELRRLKGEVG